MNRERGRSERHIRTTAHSYTGLESDPFSKKHPGERLLGRFFGQNPCSGPMPNYTHPISAGGVAPVIAGLFGPFPGLFTVMKYLVGSLAAYLLVISAGVADAQWWGGVNYASTAAEGYARGMADVIQSAGQANLANSAAAGNYEAAYSMYLDNRIKYTKTYYENKQLYKEYKQSQKTPPPTSEQLFRMSQVGVPKALSANQLDPLTGEIAWPLLLQEPQYAQYRKDLEDLFKIRADSPVAFTYDSFMKVEAIKSQFIDALTANIKNYKPQDWIAAKKFIESLAFEARRV
jgi:hypothetical protein